MESCQMVRLGNFLLGMLLLHDARVEAIKGGTYQTDDKTVTDVAENIFTLGVFLTKALLEV